MTSFRTKRGRCILDDENLYLSSSWTGQFRRYWEGGKFGKLMIFSLAMLPLVVAVNTISLGQNAALEGLIIGFGLGTALLVFSYIVNYFRDFSNDHVIPRDSIEKFKAVEGSKGVSRPRFIVKFEKNGEIQNRYIMMPSKFLSYGEEEFKGAKEKLRDEGFEVIEEN